MYLYTHQKAKTAIGCTTLEQTKIGGNAIGWYIVMLQWMNIFRWIEQALQVGYSVSIKIQSFWVNCDDDNRVCQCFFVVNARDKRLIDWNHPMGCLQYIAVVYWVKWELNSINHGNHFRGFKRSCLAWEKEQQTIMWKDFQNSAHKVSRVVGSTLHRLSQSCGGQQFLWWCEHRLHVCSICITWYLILNPQWSAIKLCFVHEMYTGESLEAEQNPSEVVCVWHKPIWWAVCKSRKREAKILSHLSSQMDTVCVGGESWHNSRKQQAPH